MRLSHWYKTLRNYTDAKMSAGIKKKEELLLCWWERGGGEEREEWGLCTRWSESKRADMMYGLQPWGERDSKQRK